MRISDLKYIFKLVYAAFCILANDKRLYLLTEAVTAGTTETTAPAGSIGLTSNSTGRLKIFVSNGTVWIDMGRGYAVYTAIVTQAGTDAPTATVLDNSLGGAVTLGRSSAGVYTFTRTGVFMSNKTFIEVTVDSGATGVITRVARTSANVVTITVATEAGVAADLVGNLNLEIRVYP